MTETLRLWWAWLMVPWRQTSLALAMIGAAAAPAFLLAAADVWESSAADDFTTRLVSELEAGEAGVSVVTDGLFAPQTLAEADAVVSRRMESIASVAPPIKTIVTFRVPGTILPEQIPVAVPLRLMARPGALDSVEIVSQAEETSGGVWVSRWLSEERGVEVGDVLAIESAVEPEEPGAEVAPGGGDATQFEVVGVYQTLWSADGTSLSRYWQDVAEGLIPVYLDTFREPNFSLVLTEESTLSASPTSGQIQWDSPIQDRPETLSDLRSLAAEYRSLEADLLSDPAIASALARLADQAGAVSSIRTELTEALAQVEAGVAVLGQPLAAGRIAGALLGLGVMISSAFFVVDRHRLEYRLSASEGDRWILIGSRFLSQMTLPVGIGATVGIVAAIAVGRWAGPASNFSPEPVQWAPIGGIAVLGLILTAIAVGVVAQRTLETRGYTRSSGRGWTAISFLALAGFAWFQTGRDDSIGASALDLGVVLLPVLVLIAAVSLTILVVHRATRRSRFAGQGLPTPAYLAWRRAASSDATAQLIVSALAVGVGLVVFSTVVVTSLNRSIDVTVATVVGAETRSEVVRKPEPGAAMPDETTVISIRRSRIVPGDIPVKVLAVDTETFGEVAAWPPEYGADVGELMQRLDQEVESGLQAVAIAGQGVPDRGAFTSSGTPFPFQVTQYVDGLPLAEETGAVLMISADRLDEWELERLAAVVGAPADSAEVQSRFVAPTDGFRTVLISNAGVSDVEGFISRENLVPRETVARTDITDTVDVIAPLVAFEYLALLGYLAAVSALAALTMYLASRREKTGLASVMLQRMGLSRSGVAQVTAIEVVGLTALGAVVAFAAAPIVADHLVTRFDPVPLLPPEVGIQLSVAWFAVAIAATLASVGSLVWLSEWALASRDQGGLLRAHD